MVSHLKPHGSAIDAHLLIKVIKVKKPHSLCMYTIIMHIMQIDPD